MAPDPDSAGWSPARRSASDLVRQTEFPACVLWGPDLVLAYNEAYAQIIGDKHPSAFGSPATEVFPEAWHKVGPWMQQVFDGGGSFYLEDELVPLARRGFLEDCYFTFSYSPVPEADGSVGGVLIIATETTRQVLDRRRLTALARLGDALAGVERREDLVRRALDALAEAPDDLPAVDVRLPGVAAGATDAPLPAAPTGVLPRSGLRIEDLGDGERIAWAPLDVGAGGRPPLLVAALSPRLAVDDAYREFLRLLAATLTQALVQIAKREAERGLSEALQRSLLTQPLQPDHLQVAVRYRPSAEEAQVGGDWYDAFLLPGGALALAVGDVAGHDRDSAAAMAQVRNVLRGIAYATNGSPAEVLRGLDAAMQGLAVDAYATAVLARIEQIGDDAEHGRRTLRWSNAGHPPPVLVQPDGTAELLEVQSELLLGLTGDAERTDHTRMLLPGATLVLYTDGLIERRTVPIGRQLDKLTSFLATHHTLPAEVLCDRLVEAFGEDVEDDVALLVLRAHPEDVPRPAAAGPEVRPADLRVRTG